MTPAIDVTAEQRRTILALLNRRLPDTAVRACGSCVKGTSHPASDPNLVVFARPEQSAQVAEPREAFEESSLPFRVDLFVWDEVPESFRTPIEAEHSVLSKDDAIRKDNERSLESGESMAEEGCALAAAHDTLLPKLISGERQVRNAEKIVGAPA